MTEEQEIRKEALQLTVGYVNKSESKEYIIWLASVFEKFIKEGK